MQWLYDTEALLLTRVGGNTLEAWADAALAVVLGFLLGKLTYFLLTRVLLRLTAHTNTDFDDKLIGRTARPFSLAVLFGCAWLALRLLELPPLAVKLMGGTLLGALALTAAVILMRVIDVLFENLAEPWALRHEPPVNVQVIHVARVTSKIVGGTLVMVFVLQRAGFDVWSVITGLGIGGVAVALAAQQTLGNLFGSLQVMTDQPFRVGDWIRVDQHFGRVQHIGMRSTRIVTTAGQTFVVPNKHVAEATIENAVGAQGQVREFFLSMPYDLDAERLQLACDLVLKVLAETPGVHPEFLAQVWAFAEWSVQIRVIYRVPDLAGFSPVAHAVNLGIKRQFDEAGLVFAYPTRTVHLVGADAGAVAGTQPLVVRLAQAETAQHEC
ncbi:MAG: mechanosensitive ion channel family protein [Deltaproteobacteria bacterium]|nr:mechanosensitive ion channel family protein [Deltaproteobacteria bacterium]